MKLIFIVGIVSIALYWTAQASPAIYTLSGTGTGSLGAIPFSDAAFTITSTADTANIEIGPPGVWLVPDLTATVSVSGIGSATFTIPTENIINFEVGVAGITAPDQSIILSIQNTAFISNNQNLLQGYDLSSSVSPVTGTTSTPFNVEFETTAGAFSLSFVSSVTYQADIVPEPSIYALLGMGVIGFALSGRRHKT